MASAAADASALLAFLSIADRACLALAVELGVPAVTTDRAWTSLDIAGLQVTCLR